MDLTISDEDTLTVELAALLHDIGRVEVYSGHAKASAKIVSKWIASNRHLSSCIPDTEKLIALIEKHSDKTVIDSDICFKLLKDADILDEIGVISIFMEANKVIETVRFFLIS